MSTGTNDTPASLHGPVSLFFGIAAVVTTAAIGVAGFAVPLLAAPFAITFGVLGLVSGTNRKQCSAGLVGGGASVLYLAYLIIGMSI